MNNCGIAARWKLVKDEITEARGRFYFWVLEGKERPLILGLKGGF
jgi:hypothetical protein